LESFVDRIYIIKPYSLNEKEIEQDIASFVFSKERHKDINYIFDNPNHPFHTKYCLSVRPFDDLVFDLLRWKDDLLH
jgi:hypothetical protein